VGTPGQEVRVMVSTNGPFTAVVDPTGCSARAFTPNSVPSDCALARGQLYNSSLSSSWIYEGFFGLNENGIGFEANLGYSDNVDYGLDTVGLGFTNGPDLPTLTNQTVGVVAEIDPFYV
jgi:hypothetical protein